MSLDREQGVPIEEVGAQTIANEDGNILVVKHAVANQRKVEEDHLWRAAELQKFYDEVHEIADKYGDVCSGMIRIDTPEVMLTGNFVDYVSDIVNLEPQVLVNFKATIIRRKELN